MSQSHLELHSQTEAAVVAGSTFASELDLTSTSAELLGTLLDQSLDCIKLINPEGSLQYVNRNGLCAMEMEGLTTVLGRQWSDLWPPAARKMIEAALKDAASSPVRFEAFCPTAKGSPRWWDVSLSRVEDRQGRWLGYLSISRDVTPPRLAQEVAEISAAEISHRLKNSYAMVAGLLSALARGRPEREEFVGEIKDRLSALGVAQTLFVARENAPCDIHELLPALLGPFDHPECPIAVKDLPHVVIDQGQADAIALVFGELAVNSSKHGALTSQGTIAVEAAFVSDELVIRWSERSSREVEAHSRTDGQGLRLIRRILSARKGSLSLEWTVNGLDAIITLHVEPRP
ncbi:MAG: PAS domain-containing protein [Sphingomicrobium sp.]